jgi:hypothetical protein
VDDVTFGLARITVGKQATARHFPAARSLSTITATLPRVPRAASATS